MLRESLRLYKVNRRCSLSLSYLGQSGSITLREQGSLASVGGRRCASLQAKGSPIVAQLDTFSYCLKVIVKLSEEFSSILRSLLNHQRFFRFDIVGDYVEWAIIASWDLNYEECVCILNKMSALVKHHSVDIEMASLIKGSVTTLFASPIRCSVDDLSRMLFNNFIMLFPRTLMRRLLRIVHACLVANNIAVGHVTLGSALSLSESRHALCVLRPSIWSVAGWLGLHNL